MCAAAEAAEKQARIAAAAAARTSSSPRRLLVLIVGHTRAYRLSLDNHFALVERLRPDRVCLATYAATDHSQQTWDAPEGRKASRVARDQLAIDYSIPRSDVHLLDPAPYDAKRYGGIAAAVTSAVHMNFEIFVGIFYSLVQGYSRCVHAGAASQAPDVVLRTRPDITLSVPLVAPLVEALVSGGAFHLFDHHRGRTREVSMAGAVVAGCVRVRGVPPHADLSEVSFAATREAMEHLVDRFNITDVARWILADGRTPSPEFFLRRHFDAAVPPVDVLPYPRDSLHVLKLVADGGGGGGAGSSQANCGNPLWVRGL
eukprot:4540110-Prymnesium_polylepis.1